jgi:hypothetical protein
MKVFLVLCFSAMKGIVVAALLLLLAGCGGGSKAPSAPSSPAGSWTAELNMNGTTESLFQATLVPEAIVDATANGGACDFAIDGTTLAFQSADLMGCFIAETSPAQGSLSCGGCVSAPQVLLIETLDNSTDINFLLVETDPDGIVLEFGGNGTFVDGSMSGNWTCSTLSTCSGWAGDFTLTPQ